MVQVAHEEVFIRKLREFEGLISHASKRCSIQGVLEPEDLYQEGLAILDGMFRRYSFDPDSADFRKMFKTELWHGLAHILRDRKASKRDYGRHEDLDVFDLDDSEDSRLVSPDPSSEEAILLREAKIRVDSFFDHLVARLDAEASQVFYELRYPRDWDDIPEEDRVTRNDETFLRTPSKLPQQVIAKSLKMPLIRFRRALSRIRKLAIELEAEVDLRHLFPLVRVQNS